jgi:cbb3-type cytochrome oxidase subunit 3
MSEVIGVAAAESTQLGWLMGVMTVGFVAVFVGWGAWAWLPSRRAAMEAAANLPLEGEDA